MRLTAHPLVCQQAVELMSDYLEGSLSKRDRKRLEKHLAGCPHCTAYLEQMRVTIAISGTVRPEDLEPEALDELTELFRQYRGQEDNDES